MKFAPNSFRAFSLIELLIALSMISLSFIFFSNVLLKEDSLNKNQSLKISVCDTIQRHCVYHVSSNKSIPLINVP
ncbi:MAG: prepilin-type N-terminal cleavage/methylation domain-containing protein [Helicobacter sp.]|nr:prepilin-type N-terminal cleavage/methylation domain-containing protein [Helicobacter sp.]